METLANRVRLDTVRDDGYSKRHHLQAAVDQGLPVPELDVATEAEPRFTWIMMVFDQLCYGRTYAANGAPLAISHQEIKAWCDLNDEKLSKIDLQILRQLDTTWIIARRELAQEAA